MQLLTITHPSELDRALVLAESVAEFTVNPQITVLVVADQVPERLPSQTNVNVTTPGQLGISFEDSLTATLDSERLLEALRGSALDALLKDGEPVLFLDHSLRVVGPLDAIATALETSDIVLVPYDTSNGIVKAAAAKSRSHGVFHPGIIALRPGDEANRLIAHWPSSEIATEHEVEEYERTAFQAWLDALPVQFRTAEPLCAPRFVAGHWNLDGVRDESDERRLLVDGHPVGLIDFSDFDPLRPHLLSTEDSGAPLSALPTVSKISARHASDLLANSVVKPTEADPYAELPDGTKLNLLLRSLVAQALKDGGVTHSIFTTAGMHEFYAWLNQPSTSGAFAGLTRYHEAIWHDLEHLRAAYPHLDGPDAIGYAGWIFVHSPELMPMPDVLLPPQPAHVTDIVEPVRTKPPWGVNVAGFFSAELGLGEAARLLIGGLDAANVPALPVQGTLTPPCRQGSDFVFANPDTAPFPINIVCMNGDTIPHFARDAGQHFFENRYSIALWWWEVGEFPDGWMDAFDYLNEIWVASDHIYEVIAAVSPIPVYKVPMPVIVPRIVPYTRAELGMPEDDFVFLFVFDYHSTAQRKNPVGVVNAFKEAFPEPGSGASLVLKCINSDKMPDFHEEVLIAIGDRPDIQIIDRYVTAAEKDAIIADCDCYVSLHRSEGFGLTPAEAMWQAKPVIATRYGGILEFMTPENSYLVDYEEVKVGKHAHPYPAEATWAEPNLEQASQLMRHVFDNQEEAREVGLRAYDSIRKTNGPLVAGLAMEKRLEIIYANLENDPKYSLNADRRKAKWQHPGDTKGAGPLYRLKRTVKMGLFRFERFGLRRQRELDSAVNSIERQIEAANAETLSEFRRIRSELSDVRRQIAASELEHKHESQTNDDES
jgi:glycosyltransferase involved in cell wall biosynthesis